MTTITMSRAMPGQVAPSRRRRVGPGGAVRSAAGVRPVPAQARLRLTRRGRLVLVALCAAVLVLASVLVSGRAASADAPASAPVVERHVVASGETLWEIASSISGPGEDVRDVILELAELNGLADSSLVAGQTIVLPVQG